MANCIRLRRDQRGTSLVEVMVATVVFMTIMLGGLNYFTLPQATVAREKMRRLAVTQAQQRMETILGLDYAEITADLNETVTSVPLAKISGSINTTILTVDDVADGLGLSDADSDTRDYKNITVKITWSDGNAQSVSFSTCVSAFENQYK